MDKQQIFKDGYVNSYARGIRNNNPGNIDYNSKNKWQGELPFDSKIEPRHCRFVSHEYGIRALMKLLQTYSKHEGKTGIGCGKIDTVEEIIERWAPAKDRNNTEGYIKRVCKETGFDRHDCLDVFNKETSIKMAKAIVHVENGQQPYVDDVFERAFALI
ncbi:structural protein [Providencia rettgeri]|uniref:structural protein n=1 Tax=Providencia rettgeri TaxID=587 RepID=UPI0020B7C0D0|nr:structural protein [Providencia rettgeri]